MAIPQKVHWSPLPLTRKKLPKPCFPFRNVTQACLPITAKKGEACGYCFRGARGETVDDPGQRFIKIEAWRDMRDKSHIQCFLRPDRSSGEREDRETPDIGPPLMGCHDNKRKQPEPDLR